MESSVPDSTEIVAPESNPAAVVEAVVPAAESPAPTPEKKIGALVLDSGGLIKNEIAISTLISQAEELYTIPAVLAELKDEATRARIQPLMPFLKLRNPRPDSSKFISDFARKTGDLSVLSRVDLQLLALTYELEKERNKGDWRLRNDPGQKTLNGRAPGSTDDSNQGEVPVQESLAPEPCDQPTSAEKPQSEVEIDEQFTNADQQTEVARPSEELANAEQLEAEPVESSVGTAKVEEQQAKEDQGSNLPDAGQEPSSIGTEESVAVDLAEQDTAQDPPSVVAADLSTLSINADTSSSSLDASGSPVQPSEEQESANNDGIEDDDDGEWITPSNLDKHRKRDKGLGAPQPIEKMLQAALLTTDNAMRNVALRINLNLLDPSFARVTYIKSWVLRCHTCMKICKEQRQFCPSCGHPTLTRVSVSTDSNNNFTIHLKKNFQWNNRGNVYSIPKPTHGSASGKTSNVKGGGKGGWGQELILAEDQKEFSRKVDEQRRTRFRDLMDEDYLPSILTGNRSGSQGKVKVGAGRNVNSKKRR